MRPTTTVARRYAPFLMLAAVQVVVVAIAPSTGGPSRTFDRVAGPAAAPGEQVAPGAGVPAAAGDPGAATVAGPSGSTRTGPVSTAGATSAGPGRLTEDRSKCAPGGERQQTVTLNSPPCVPRFAGNNGGTTYQGVTATSVRVLRYRPKENAQVQAILRTQGLASTPEEEKHAMDAFAKFFEKHYELYGRKIEWINHQGTCEISPPDTPCFRDEVKRLNAEFKPFIAFYTSSTTQGEFFEQWSQLGVVNIGGWHFNAKFNATNRPYHWDVFMDGTRTARNVAEYWCKKMQGKNATLAGDVAMRARKRKVGIITQDFEVTRPNALDFVRYVRGEMCGTPADAADPVYTPSDISRAQQTALTAMQKLQDDGVTTVVIMSDPIGPRYFTNAATGQAYYPEHLLAGSGLIDYDVLGRLYEHSQWVNAFGPGHLADPIPFNQTDAARAAADVGVTGLYSGANLMYAYMSVAAAMVQVSGPTLTPPNVERGMLTLPAGGGWELTKNPASVLVKFGPGDYTAIEDSRHTYWSPTATSKIDGGTGAYIALSGGRRWEIGTWPAGEPRQ